MPYLSAQEVAFEPECDELQESRLQGEGLGSGIGRDSIRSRAITLAAPSLHPCLHFNLAASYTINDKRFFVWIPSDQELNIQLFD